MNLNQRLIASTEKQLAAAKKATCAYPMKGNDVKHYTQLLNKLKLKAGE